MMYLPPQHFPLRHYKELTMKSKLTLAIAGLLLTASGIALATAERTITRTVELDLSGSSAITSIDYNSDTKDVTYSTGVDGTRSLPSQLSINPVGFSATANRCKMTVTGAHATDGKFVFVPETGTDSSPISFVLTGYIGYSGSNLSASTGETGSGTVTGITNGWNMGVDHGSSGSCSLSLSSLYLTGFSAIPSDMTGKRTAQIDFTLSAI